MSIPMDTQRKRRILDLMVWGAARLRADIVELEAEIAAINAAPLPEGIRRFTESDWYGWSGAERLWDGSEPLAGSFSLEAEQDGIKRLEDCDIILSGAHDSSSFDVSIQRADATCLTRTFAFPRGSEDSARNRFGEALELMANVVRCGTGKTGVSEMFLKNVFGFMEA